MAKWDITINRELLDTVEADAFLVEGGAAVFFKDGQNVGAIGLSGGVFVKMSFPTESRPSRISEDPIVAANLNRLINRKEQ